MLETAKKSAIAIRLTTLWLVCSSCFGADLESLRVEHRWFQLREALKTQSGSALDRGAAAAAFQHVREAERWLATSHDEAARDLLADVYIRSGLYQKALSILQTSPVAHEEIATLAQLADQSSTFHGISRIRGEIRRDLLFAPVTVNGHDSKALLDTGSNMSVVSQSEARRLGLRIVGSARIGTAEQFAIGGLRMRHVAFWILSDEEPPFRDLPEGERVVLGLPAFLAMGGLRWRPDGAIEIGIRIAGHEPNLCFDKMNPMVRVEAQGKSLEMLLDTGSSRTYLAESDKLADVKLRLSGADLTVRPARGLPTNRLGFDSLKRGGAVDFRAMVVTVE
jgi:predicted aspartyl protease